MYIRVIALAFLFIHKVKERIALKKNPYMSKKYTLQKSLTLAHLKAAETYWWLQVQSIQFTSQLQSLQKKENVHADSPLAVLNPYLDSKRVIRRVA